MSNGADMVTVKYQFVVEDRDRHGNVRLYFRRKDYPKVRLHETPGTPEFAQRHRDLIAKSNAGEPLSEEDGTAAGGAAQPKAPTPGTWRWLCVQYFASSAFHELDVLTQKPRRGILESTFDEPVYPGATETYADFPLSRMTAKAIRVLRDRKLATRTAANARMKAINYVFSWALSEEPPPVKTNPARDVPLLSIPGTGIHSWTVDEVRQYEKTHPVGTMARLALAIFLFTGMRRSDAIRLGRQHAKSGWFKFRQFKGRNHSPIDIEIPILPELQSMIDATPTGDMTYLVTAFGRPFADAGFGNKMRAWCDAAGLPQCSAHGLRKAGATIAAENGATVHQLMSIFGWMTLKEAERYTKAAERKRLAGGAMHLLRRSET